MWDAYSKQQRKLIIQKWKQVDELEDAARKYRGIYQIAPEEVELYKKVLADISKKLEPEAVPCMPVITHEMKLAAIKAATTKTKSGPREGSNVDWYKSNNNRSAPREGSKDYIKNVAN